MRNVKSSISRAWGIFQQVLLLLVVSLALVTPTGSANTNKNVDLILLLALDVSSSVDVTEYRLQREGLARAISAPEVVEAIRGGAHGRIAVSVIQWSGFSDQTVKIDWGVLETPAGISEFAKQVRSMKRRYSRNLTDISGAIEFSRKHILSAPYIARRKVLDISGDGRNNVNLPPTIQRDRSIAAGITINGLVILNEAPYLQNYYQDFVIGGPGAFVERANDYVEYRRAMVKKLLKEIGGPLLF